MFYLGAFQKSSKLYVVVVEESTNVKKASRVKYQRVFNITFPTLKTEWDSDPKAFSGLVLKSQGGQKLCSTSNNPFYSLVKGGLDKILFENKSGKHAAPVKKLLAYLFGFWGPTDGKSFDELVDENIHQVCLTATVAMRCFKGLGPPGECSHKRLSCGKIVRLEDTLAHQRQGSRRKRSVVAEPSLCSGRA